MNDQQRSAQNSNIAVRTVCQKDAFRSLWSSLPAFVLFLDRFIAKVAYVNACALLQIADTKGITEAKGDARRKLIDSIIETLALLTSFGFLSGDTALVTECDLPDSDTTRLDDLKLDTFGTALLARARNLPPPAVGQPTLSDVGLTAGKLDLLETRLETYNLLLGSPRTAIGGKKAATENLQLGLDEAQEILEKGLDKLTTQFKGTDFHKEYWSARKSINTAIRHEKPEENTPPVQP